jgi:hypothetical protein
MLLVGMELLWTQTSDADLATEGDVSGVNLTWIHSDAGCVNLVGLAAESAEFKDALFCSMSPGTGPISTALIGDSMANALFPGLRDVYAERGERIINIGNGTCAPFRGMDGALPYNRECASINEKIYAFLLARNDIKTVIWAFAPWDAATMRIRGVRVSTPLKQRFLAIAQLEEADFKTLSTAGKRVVVTYDTPFLGIRPLDCLHGSSSCETTEQAVAARMEPTRSAWTELFLSQPGPCIFSQDSLFRLPGGRYRLLGDDGPLFRDDHHLSLAGSALVARSFTKSLCLD